MDFQGIIHRLRPDSRYLLRDGGGALYADILEWQDPETTQPTEAECMAEWDVMLAEREAARLENDALLEMESTARTGWKDLGVWSTWEPQQAQDYVNAEILNGMDQAQIDAWIDANITGTTIAQLRTQTVAALKLLSGNLITLRNIVGVIAKVILYIRDILIKRL